MAGWIGVFFVFRIFFLTKDSKEAQADIETSLYHVFFQFDWVLFFFFLSLTGPLGGGFHGVVYLGILLLPNAAQQSCVCILGTGVHFRSLGGAWVQVLWDSC